MALRLIKALYSKGQITIEYLVLSLVALALLSVSISILIQINKTSHQAIDNLIFRKSALDLYASIEEVCALGVGNSRTIIIKTNMAVSKNRQDVVIENDQSGSLKFELSCPYEISAGQLNKGKAIIAANKNEIEIKNIE